MKLGFLDSNSSEEIKNHIVKIAKRLNNSLETTKHTFSKKQLSKLSDALAIAETLKMNFSKMNGSDIKQSTKRFSKLVKAVFQEDVFPSDFRREIKQRQQDFVKTVEPRSEGEGRRLGDTYKDMPSDFYQEKSCSAQPPLLIAERIMRDMKSQFYHSVQDAYDGYCQKNGPYVYASARQKVRLAQILQFYGFAITADKWEKESEDDYKEWKKMREDLGKGERNPEDRLIHHAQKKKDDEIEYCSACKKTTHHIVKGETKYKCKDCGREKTKQEKKAVSKDAQEWISNKISKLVDEGMSQEKAVGAAHSMARDKGYDVPKKGQQSGNDPRMSLEDGGYADRNQDSSAIELTKTGIYGCAGCGYEEKMEKQGDYNCPKCGAMMKYSDMGGEDEDPARVEEHGKIPMPIETVDEIAENPELKHDYSYAPLNEEYEPGAGQSYSNILNDDNRYRTMIENAIKENGYLSVDAVSTIDKDFAESMTTQGISRVKARYLQDHLKRAGKE